MNPARSAPWLRRFLAEYVVTERNLARNTQLSYRDTFVLLIPFVSARVRRAGGSPRAGRSLVPARLRHAARGAHEDSGT